MSGTRVGLVCGYLDPRRDGVADYTRRLAVHLRAAGLDPLVVTTYELARASGEDAVGVTRRWNVRGVASAARAIRQLDLDLVHVQFAPSVFGFSRAVGLLPLLLPGRIPLIVTLHEFGAWSGRCRGRGMRSALWSAAERCGYAERETLLLAPRATCLLVPSAEHLDVLQARLRRRTPPTVEVPIGLNVEIATGDKTQARADVRRAFGAAPDAPLIVFFGFLHPSKALDQLITAVAAVRAQLPGTQLLLIGGEVSHSVPSNAAYQLRQDLERVAAARGVQDQVHFTGYLPDAEVSRLLRAADVAAFPFRAGVTRKSSSLLAACAAGLPVVATAAPGQGPGPSKPDGVFLVPPDDTAALAEALGRVLSDRALADRLRAAGRARAATQSWDAIAAAHAEVYARALVSHRVSESPSASWTGTPEPSRVVPSTRVEGKADVTAWAGGAGRREVGWRTSTGDVGGRAAVGSEGYRGSGAVPPLVYGDPARLHISPTAVVNNALFNLSSGEITVGDYAFFGHNVSVLTGTHDWTKFGAERQVAMPKSGRDVVIEEAFGCPAMVETPNPSNLRMAACDFYNDPTHRTPLPPALTEFLVSASGFGEVEVRPLNPNQSSVGPARADCRQVERLVAHTLYGPQDYAVLGHKRPTD